MRATLLVLAACTPGSDLPDPTDTVPADEQSTFRLALTADPHVIGDAYDCCEGSNLDTESIYRSRRRLASVRDQINAIEPAPERVLMAGDLLHANYRYPELADYRDPNLGSSAFRAKEILDGFTAPVDIALGNHDYGPDRDFTHLLFRELFDTEPYQAIVLHGWKIILLDTQHGTEPDPMDQFLRTVSGTLGREQLAWLAAELDEGLPTILVAHHHPLAGTLVADEDPDGAWADVFTVVDAYADVVRGMFFGHLHRWWDVENVMGVPASIIGGIRYDGDNFWVAELDVDGENWDIIDFDKAVFGTVNGRGSSYEDGGAAVDTMEDAEEDPAGPWDDWTTPPDPWPPVDD